MARHRFAAVAVCALAVAGCGSSSSSSSPTPPSNGGAAVTYQSFDASPKTITVKVGQTITWTNNDGPAHDVKSTSGPAGDKIASSAIPQGGTFRFTPKTAGTINYVCTFHPQMTGYKITVTQ